MLISTRPGLCDAVRRFLDGTGEGLGHLGLPGGLRLVVPELLLVAAGHVWHDELDVSLHQLALLPRHGLALVSPRPDLSHYLLVDIELSDVRHSLLHLLSILVCLPERDAVLFCDIPTLRKLFLVRDCLLPLVTRLLHEELRGQFLLNKLLRLQTHGAVLVGDDLALGLRHVEADVL